jgi:CheY-like chemotaxis protein
MDSEKPAVVIFSHVPGSDRWRWAVSLENPGPTMIKKEEWRHFSFWLDRKDEGREGIEDAFEKFKSIAEDLPPPNHDILVVDDDMAICELMMFILNQVGLRVWTAPDGPEGLELLKSPHFDLLIIDNMMPTLDGYEMVRLIRAETRWDDIPAILFTAGDRDEAIYLEIGFDRCMTKPAAPSTIYREVRTALVEGRRRVDMMK